MLTSTIYNIYIVNWIILIFYILFHIYYFPVSQCCTLYLLYVFFIVRYYSSTLLLLNRYCFYQKLQLGASDYNSASESKSKQLWLRFVFNVCGYFHMCLFLIKNTINVDSVCIVFQPSLQLPNKHRTLAPPSVLGQTASANLLHHRSPSLTVGDPKAIANSVASSATASTQQTSFWAETPRKKIKESHPEGQTQSKYHRKHLSFLFYK